MRRPTQHILGAAFAALAMIVAINAVFLQSGPHPSPLFSDASGSTDVAVGPAGGIDPVRQATDQGAGPAGIDDILAGRLPGERADGVLVQAAVNEAGGVAPAAGGGLVADLQGALAAKGLYAGATDGRLDTATVQAIGAFQRSRGLQVTGEPSVDLLVALATGAPAARPEIVTIARVQVALNERGFGPLDVDGLMGRMTGEAIRRYQQANGLPETGEVDGSLEASLGIGRDV